MHVSQSWRLEVPFQGATWFGEGPVLVVDFSLCPHVMGGVRVLCGIYFGRALIPFMSTRISWPSQFPKASPTITITSGVRISAYESGARDTNIRTIENPLQNVSCVPQFKFIAAPEIGWGLPANWRPWACLLGQMSGVFLRELQSWDDSLCLLFLFLLCLCFVSITSEHHMFS